MVAPGAASVRDAPTSCDHGAGNLGSEAPWTVLISMSLSVLVTATSEPLTVTFFFSASAAAAAASSAFFFSAASLAAYEMVGFYCY